MNDVCYFYNVEWDGVIMNNTYTKHISNLLNSVAQKLDVAELGVVLIKHYNSYDIKQEIVDKIFLDKKGVKYVYHEFDGSVMADAYEPFLSSIKDFFYKEYNNNMTVDEFFEECGVYKLHRSVLKSYFETGICQRADEVFVSEYQYECYMMQENIANMIKYISSKEKLFFVFNKLNNANESTIRILLGMIDNEKYSNVCVVATYNEMNNIPNYVLNLWEEYMDYLVHKDLVIEWSFREKQVSSDFNRKFNFSVDKIPEYMKKLRNMYHMMAIVQAEYYFNLIYKKVEIEKLDIPEKYLFDFMELYAEVALMLEKNSDAMIYAEVMKNISDENISDKEFRYKYLLAQIYMLSGLNEEAKKVAVECSAIVEKQGNEFDMFRVELISFLSGYSGWKKKMFLDRNAEVSDSLLEKAEKYGYYNQLAHIYIFAFDNKGEQFRDIEKLEENLKHFYKGIQLAKDLGNEGLLAEGYKKNVMMASTNGMFDISNFYYELLTEVDLIKNDAFEMANIYNGLGYNNCIAEKFEKAHEYYNKELIMFDKMKEPVYVGETLYNMLLMQCLPMNIKLHQNIWNSACLF